MFKSRVLKFEYTRNKPSVKYVLLCQRWERRHRDLIGYDITQLAQKAVQEDQQSGYPTDKGMNLGWLIYKALQAGDAHTEVLGRWNKSKSLEDRDFYNFRHWHMINSNRSVDVYDWTKNLVEPEFDEWYFLDKVDLQNIPHVDTTIDFKPKIGIEGGIWRNYKSEFVQMIKEYQF